ncbi:redoxin family protein [Saccharopolyspora indica]|uniref:redoxin family protein n=1 Tax=Saccharopolyspora indica TaxID=1229659 RepID=UPI0022EA8B31|nr:redoxin family protein [Saccharopolyspora indica]MDA3643022.1 redoxin family protein [Saccharopolyspora indica]
MRIGELAQRAQVSAKAIRYYEQLGLVTPLRGSNGYRSYDESHVRLVEEIRELAADGIPPSRARPFIECLGSGHVHSDDCVTSLIAYRDSIAELDRTIAALTARRDLLIRRLHRGATRSFTEENGMTDYTTLPEGLPVPEDDGAADHLSGMSLPALTLSASNGQDVDLGALAPGRTIIYCYPLTGRPGTDLPEGWDAIPGARGCSTEACDFRDHFADLQQAGVSQVFGLSSQDAEYQAELVERLHLPFPMLSDPRLTMADALRLPTFEAPGHDRLYSRLTLVISNGRIEHVFYPVFPPNAHAQQVLDWLT